MRMTDILYKKKNGESLSQAEIAYFVEGFTADEIPDYQAAALLMAICLRQMSDEEAVWLTDCMARSGDRLDLSAVQGITADKHSTGGVGDKTTLVVAPVCAALGLKIAKMSGRGLGHTGGTLDKLESIPGFQTTLSNAAFLKQVREIGLSVIGQTGNLAPADKKLYALRDATQTVDNLALIAASIMSKKLAAGAQNIVLDVKCGSGAFMQTLPDAIHLAELMVKIGKSCQRNVSAVITDMDVPLGTHIGNALEVTEAVEILQNRGDEGLRTLCLTLSAQLVSGALQMPYADAYQAAVRTLQDGTALLKLQAMVAAQGGDASVLTKAPCFLQAPAAHTLCAVESGYITHMQTRMVGESASILGAGRATKADRIDPAAGICLHKKTGDFVNAGDPLATFYAADAEKIAAGEARFQAALSFGKDAPAHKPILLKTIC